MTYLEWVAKETAIAILLHSVMDRWLQVGVPLLTRWHCQCVDRQALRLFAFENMFSTILQPSVIHKLDQQNDQHVILLFVLKYFVKSSMFNCIQWKNKTNFGTIKMIFTFGGRFKWLIVVIYQQVQIWM